MPRERGQSTVDLLAVVPALLSLLLGAGQAVALGWALVEAADAARTGARAAAMGGDAEALARRALPPSLRGGADVTLVDDGLLVRVEAPRLVPHVPLGVDVTAVP